MDPLVLSELKRTKWINLCDSNDLILFKKKGDKLRGNLEFNTDLTSLFNVFISFP
jgi:protein required for attachment to host cells